MTTTHSSLEFGLAEPKPAQLLDHLRQALDLDVALVTRREDAVDRCVAVSAASTAARQLTGQIFAVAEASRGTAAAIPIMDGTSNRLGTLIGLRQRDPRPTTASEQAIFRATAALLRATPGLDPADGARAALPVITTVVQPIAELRTGRVVAVEALTRFAGDPAPDPEFMFTMASAAGISGPLEMAAVHSALKVLPSLPANMRLYLNASPEVACSPEIHQLLANAGPDRLTLELTEYETADTDRLNAALGPLRALGMHLAVDDLGTGHANLDRLIDLRPDVVKLDLTLTAAANSDPYRLALLRALASFAHDTGVVLIAEGIESAAQRQAIQQAGVGYGQGYLLGRPAAIHELAQTLRRSVETSDIGASTTHRYAGSRASGARAAQRN